MKRFLLLVAMAAMMFALVIGCGEKADEAADKVPVETKAAEMMDSTRMDEMVDSAKAMLEGVVDSLEAKVDEHEGHDH